MQPTSAMVAALRPTCRMINILVHTKKFNNKNKKKLSIHMNAKQPTTTLILKMGNIV